MVRNTLLSISLLSCLILWLGGDAAARARTETLAELSARAQGAGIVRCVEAASSRSGPRGMIFTMYRFERLAGVAGAVPESFTLRVAGGTADGYRVTIPHAPRFEAGRSYLLFLKPATSGGALLVAGAARGVLPARAGVAGGWEVAVPDRLAPGAAAKSPASPADLAEGRRWMNLEAVKALLAGPAEGGRQ